MAGFLDWPLDAPLFRDRFDAGRETAALVPSGLGPRTLVVGLARGGVQVAAEIAAARGWPLDVVAVRKVRHPYQPEYALGAVTPGGDGVYVRAGDGLSESQLADAVAQARREAAELHACLHAEHAPLDPTAAGRARRRRPRDRVDADRGGALADSGTRGPHPRRRPVAARQSVARILDQVELFTCPHVRDNLVAVGIWYSDFSPVSDDDVLRLLDEAAARAGAVTGAG